MRLSAELGLPVVETIGVKADGVRALAAVLDRVTPFATARHAVPWQTPAAADIEHDQAEVRRILGAVGGERIDGVTLSDRVDAEPRSKNGLLRRKCSSQ